VLVERQVRSVEEHHLADLGVQRIHLERRHRRTSIDIWHGEL
jgi:hypothetical protein